MEQVIYKTGEPNLQTIVKDGLCTFSGVNRENGQDFTVDEYLEFLGPGFVCIPFDDAIDQIKQVQDELYIKPWQEISVDQWNYQLEVLPPRNWRTVNGVNFFQMSEFMTSNITLHCARIDDRCFSAYRRTSANYEALANEIKTIL